MEVEEVFENLQEEEQEKLKLIFQEVSEDKNWFENSIMYDLYCQRISAVEFLTLLASDSEWSYLATQQQTKKVIALFDKVYGFAETMSRLK